MIDALCQRYGCLPSELLAEDADLMLWMHGVLRLGQPEESAEAGMEEQLAGMSRGIADGM